MNTQTISFSSKPKANIRGYISPQHVGSNMSARVKKKEIRLKLIENAKSYFTDHEIDFEKYKARLEMVDPFLCDVVFVHKKTKAVIRLKEVWFDTETGEINQAGNNYGELVF